MKRLHVFLNLMLISALNILASNAFASQEAPQTFTFDGRAFSDAAATTPLLDNITLRIQILNQAQDCILYEEQQSVSTTATNGYFTIQVGSVVGAGKRTALDSSHMMSDVYSNTLTSLSGKLVSNGGACTYNPANAHVRYVRLLMTPSDMVTRTISPNMALDSVPYASVAERAETLEGLYPANLIQVNTTAPANLTQANIESIFSTTNFPRLTSLLSVAPSNYVQTGTNGSALLPVVAGNPGSGLTSGQIWYDSTANVLKYYDGAVKTVGTSGPTTGPIVDNTNSASTAIAVTQSGAGYAGTFMGGNVGIGTTAPISLFQVSKTQSGETQISIENRNNVAASTSTALVFKGYRDVQADYQLGKIQMQSRVSGGAGELAQDGDMIFYTGGYAGLGNSPRMTILSGGNVGIGTATPAEELEVNGALKLGTTTATNAGTIRWDGANFQGYNGSVWTNFVPNPPASGACDTSNVYSSAGTYGYTVPASYGTITIQVWGGGGAGGGVYSTGNAGNGGNSSISSLGLVATGGGGGQNSNSGALGSGGSGGTASGGTTNSPGTSGGAATATNVSGAGGTAPNGGAGGASSGFNGYAGGAPGGGASGAAQYGMGTGGGGSGGYTTKTFTPATLIPGTYLNDIVVGMAGVANASSGANGGGGQVTISCSTTGTPTLNNRSLVFVSGSTYSTNANLIYDATGKLGIGTATPQTTLDVNGVVRVAKYAAQPFACDAAHDSSLAITSGYRQCICKGGTTTWVFTSDGTTTCTW